MRLTQINMIIHTVDIYFWRYQKQKQLSNYSSFTLEVNFGITGDASLAKGMQNLYHDLSFKFTKS